jgi:hypothetical protein
MKKLLVGVVVASTIFFVAMSSVSYAGDVALRSSESSTKAQQPHRATYTAANAVPSVDASSLTLARDIKARFFAVLSSLLRSSLPIAGVVVPDQPVVNPDPPLKIPPDDTPPRIPVDDVNVKCDNGWDFDF